MEIGLAHYLPAEGGNLNALGIFGVWNLNHKCLETLTSKVLLNRESGRTEGLWVQDKNFLYSIKRKRDFWKE
jgi:hypothetical protein